MAKLNVPSVIQSFRPIKNCQTRDVVRASNFSTVIVYSSGLLLAIKTLVHCAELGLVLHLFQGGAEEIRGYDDSMVQYI
jgi:hypothetical protein